MIRSAVLVLLLLAACAPSEEEIEAELAAFVSARNHCEATTDCVLVGLECPLGCFIAVRSEHERAVHNKARELVDDYESGGRSCAYDCVQAPPLECRMGSIGNMSIGNIKPLGQPSVIAAYAT